MQEDCRKNEQNMKKMRINDGHVLQRGHGTIQHVDAIFYWINMGNLPSKKVAKELSVDREPELVFGDHVEIDYENETLQLVRYHFAASF